MFWGHLIDNHALSYFPEESKEYISYSFSALIFKIKKLLVTNIFKWLKSQNMKMYTLRLLQSLSPSILFIPDRYFTSFLFFFIYFFFRQQYIFPPPPFFYKRYYNVYFFYLVNFSCYIPMHRNYIMMCRHHVKSVPYRYLDCQSCVFTNNTTTNNLVCTLSWMCAIPVICRSDSQKWDCWIKE